jgi:endonuclease III
MIKKEAIKQAKAIPEEEHRQKAIDNLKATTKLFNDTTPQVEEQLKLADQRNAELIAQLEGEDKQKAQRIVQLSKALVDKVKQGADVNEIVKQIKELQNGC